MLLEKAEMSPFFQGAMIASRREALCDQELQLQKEIYFAMNIWEGALENPSCWNYLSCGKNCGLMPEVGV